jgi:hypothetical protein
LNVRPALPNLAQQANAINSTGEVVGHDDIDMRPLKDLQSIQAARRTDCR